MESGFKYKGQDPIYEMDSVAFSLMMKDCGMDIEHPTDLKGHSLDMWRAKWVFRFIKQHPTLFVIDDEKVKKFKESLI
jgi:hypothetical protein